MPNILAFDIETIPDIEGGRRLYGLQGLNDDDVARVMFARQRERKDTEFLPLHLHRVVVISIVMRSSDGLRIWSLGVEDTSEKEIITRFFDGIDRFTPILVSWNGGGFDLPVLNYRSLILGVCAPRFWDTGDDNKEFKWNNYINRFHYRHTDLMDVLAGYQPRANAPLDQVSVLCGLPGKLGMDGSQVWPSYQDGRVADIRDYCETDALNTYLLYMKWELMRGRLSQAELGQEFSMVRQELRKHDKPHFNRFLQAWDADPS